MMLYDDNEYSDENDDNDDYDENDDDDDYDDIDDVDFDLVGGEEDALVRRDPATVVTARDGNL